MNRSSRLGITLIELLVAMAVLSAVLVVIGVFLAQQSRVVTLSQSINEAELTARTVAEGVLQDLQLAGSRAVYIGGTVNYADISPECSENSRSHCVRAISVDGDGLVTEADPGDSFNGYAVYYRTSLFPGAVCRRVDFAFIDGALYRSESLCADAWTIDLNAALFATDVTAFAVTFECTSPIAGSTATAYPTLCYAVCEEQDGDGLCVRRAFVRHATVTVDVQLSERVPTESRMEMAAATPNLRPSVNYGGN